jgi:hypothetical protein
VTAVRYPELRARLVAAVHELCDETIHRRLWLHGDRLSSSEFGFDDTLLAVIDEPDMFESLVGDILVDSAEFDALQQLRSAIEVLVRDIGREGDYPDALRSPALWNAVLVKGREMNVILAASPPTSS